DTSFQLLSSFMAGKRAVLVLTFLDKVSDRKALHELLTGLKVKLGMQVFAVDSRKLDLHQRQEIFLALTSAPILGAMGGVPTILKSAVTTPKNRIEQLLFSCPLAALLLFTPAVLAVLLANNFAAAVEPSVQVSVQPIIQALASAPSVVHEVLV